MSEAERQGFCAVIPAAGRGSRLGLQVPKLLAPLGGGRTLWDLLYARLAPLVEHVHVVLSPTGREAFEAAGPPPGRVTVSVQERPVGMGDAVFCGTGPEIWSEYPHILVLWSDQAHVSSESLERTLAAHRGCSVGRAPRLTLPVVRLADPYVELRFDEEGRLTRVVERREGGRPTPGGWGDLGLFALTTGGLREAWQDWVSGGARQGPVTGELNFLPFLAWLSTRRGWPAQRVYGAEKKEATGINEPDQLLALIHELDHREQPEARNDHER